MGLEAVCSVRFDGQSSNGKALLETSELIFRGDFRLVIPLREVQSLEVEDASLLIVFRRGEAAFELGSSRAEQWAQKIRNPRGLIDKLGLKAGQNVTVIGVDDPEFLGLQPRGITVDCSPRPSQADAVFYAADDLPALDRLPELRGRIKPNGAVWVVSLKGKAATLKDVEVMAAARAAGLVDTKVVSFSDTHTALKLVIPKARRLP